MSSFLYRLFGAAVLDAGMYEGIEADRHATWQAALTVALSSLAAGLGAGGWHGPQPATFLVFTAISLITWLAWAALIYQVGARLLPDTDTSSSFAELARTTGFAAAPGLLQVFGAFPTVTPAVFVAAWVWMIAAMVVAVQHALDYRSTARAAFVCALTALVALAVAVVVGITFETQVQ